MDDFEKELKAGFLEEASQLLTDCEQSYLQLESNPNDPAIIDGIFRVAHNIKGSSRAVGFNEMGAFAHEFENLLLKIKQGEVKPTPGVVNVCLQSNDHIVHMVNELKVDLSKTFDSTAILAEIKRAIAGEFSSDVTQDSAQTGSAAPVGEQTPNEGNSLGVPSLAEFDKITEQSAAMNESVASSEPTAPAMVEKLSAVAPKPKPSAAAAKPAGDESIRVSIHRLEKLLNYVGEMVILQAVLSEQTKDSENLMRKTVHQLGKVTKEVQDISMSLRMLPVKQTFQKMQRIVRDTASALNKQIIFKLSGEETELDKTVLESLGDPLVHLVRNAVDHGIEPAEVRLAAGKPEAGEVSLSAYHKGGQLVIEIKDDGAGLDPQKLTSKAIEKGVLKPGTVLTDDEARKLIFHPGFSTKTQVTDVSGRGVGMDVVRTNIEALSGEVLIESEVGKGTTFKVILPLTLAIIEGMVVTSDNQRFIVPLTQLHESIRPVPEALRYASNVGEVLLVREENIPLVRLSVINGRKPTRKACDSIAIIVRSGPSPFALLVDDILGQQQVVIKKLGDELAHLKCFGGSAILGDGRASLILEMNEVAKLAGKTAAKNYESEMLAS